MTNGATGNWAVRENRRAIGLQLWALRNLSLDALNGEELLHAWNGVERHARIAVEAGGSFFVDLLDRGAGGRRAAPTGSWPRPTRPPPTATRSRRPD